jgi:NodT family efflux transporter outer membrane factor (OMF) lipoprotein
LLLQVKFGAVLLVGAFLSACAVGPDFHRPAPPATATFTAPDFPAQTPASPGKDGVSQRFVKGRDIPGQWWKLFQSEQLDRLINLAFANSPTVAAAQAALREAQENRRVQLSALFPKVDAGFTAQRDKISGAAFGQPNGNFKPFTLYNASVNVSYSIDLFGGVRRGLEALQAQVDYQRFQNEGTYLTLSSNIVTTAVQEASLRAQIRATEQIVQLQQQQLALYQVRYNWGAASEVEVAAQRSQLAQFLATLPPLEKQLAQTRHLLAVLVGKFPSEATTLPEFELEWLHLPEELPLSLPSVLVRQRPDILAAEGLLHVASAEVGIATSNLYPQINLTGSYGSEAVSLGSLFGPGTTVWNIAGGLTQPIFHGGELTAKRRAAIAAYDQAAANYRETVLQAFQDVADVLQALDRDAATLKAQSEAVLSAQRTLQLTQEQLKFGAISYLSMLDAERQYQQALLSAIQAQAVRYADTAALFHALGGGWWNREAAQAAPTGERKP